MNQEALEHAGQKPLRTLKAIEKTGTAHIRQIQPFRLLRNTRNRRVRSTVKQKSAQQLLAVAHPATPTESPRLYRQTVQIERQETAHESPCHFLLSIQSIHTIRTDQTKKKKPLS